MNIIKSGKKYILGVVFVGMICGGHVPAIKANVDNLKGTYSCL